MEMNSSLLQAFNAVQGAGSEVTIREATGDKSVTIDQSEKAALFLIYPPTTFTRAGGSLPDGKPSHLPFYVFNEHTNTFDLHQIAIKYPKAQGNELRLYFNRESNFYPPAGSIWYIFVRSGVQYPFIGFINGWEWENLASGEAQRLAYEASYALDDDDDSYQKELHSPQAQRGVIQSSSTRFPRNPSLAADAIRSSNYQCQYNPLHQSFTAASSSQQYVEVHHLIPIAYMNRFQYSLDVPANLVVLCPNCHRAIHFGTSEIKRLYLEKLYSERSEYLTQAGIGISLQDLLSIYGV
ncbi:HNH endonuclease [Vibrio parahaemolyticus]